MSKKITIQDIKNRLKAVHGDSITIKEDTFKGGILSKAIFVHKEEGCWEAIVNNIVCGGTHPSVALKRRMIPISEIKQRLIKVHGDDVIIKEDTYTSTHGISTFIHKDKGEWRAYVYNVLSGMSHIDFRPKLSTQLKIEEKIKKVHGDKIKIIWDSFVNTMSKAKFIDEYGEFEAIVGNILRGQGSDAGRKNKTKNTNLRKYGAPSHMQNIEISLKSVRSQAKTTKKIHWKTNEELICQASWEPRVVEYLNVNKINYIWQPEVFKMPNGRTYRPDLYLLNEDKWVEIKGYFRKDALEKWNWFQSEHPNSELWDKKKLKEMGIL